MIDLILSLHQYVASPHVHHLFHDLTAAVSDLGRLCAAAQALTSWLWNRKKTKNPEIARPRFMDKQIGKATAARAKKKIAAGHGLNAKEFAAASGYSYATALQMFREPAFPVIHGVVFWPDWERYRREEPRRRAKAAARLQQPVERAKAPPSASAPRMITGTNRPLPPRAARLLAELDRL